MSVIGVALGVLLVTLFSGFSRGIINDMTRRANSWKAEIIFSKAGAMELTSANASVRVEYADKIRQIEGVESAMPVIKNLSPTKAGSFGVLQLDGMDWDEYARVNGMTLLQGVPAVADNEVIIDEREAQKQHVNVGGEIQLFGKMYKVTGIFAPPSGGRIKMSLRAMQNLIGAPNKCTFILVKVKNGANVREVAARINDALPHNRIVLTEDVVADAEQRYPFLRTFLRILVGLGAFVCLVFILLSMYTTITERRKEIGILKSLGASNGYIVGVIEREALLIGILGAVLGFIFSFLISFSIQKFTNLKYDLSPVWAITAALLAVVGSLLGALYPALKAAKLDPVAIMTNE